MTLLLSIHYTARIARGLGAFCSAQTVAGGSRNESLGDFGHGEFTEPHRSLLDLGSSGRLGGLAAASAALISDGPGEAADVSGGEVHSA